MRQQPQPPTQGKLDILFEFHPDHVCVKVNDQSVNLSPEDSLNIALQFNNWLMFRLVSRQRHPGLVLPRPTFRS